jgi:hypothetical protein
LQPGGALDFQSLDAAVNRLKFVAAGGFRISAPTGVGKSTRIVNRIQNLLGVPVVVIVPRREVALSVAAYMQSLYPNSGITSCTEGGDYKVGSRIVYATVQSYFATTSLQSPNNLIFFDECHISEPHYMTFHNFLCIEQRRVIYCTATPPRNIDHIEEVGISAVASFTISEAEHEFDSLGEYVKFATDFMNGRSSYEKAIIFVPSLKLAASAQSQLRQGSCIVSSKHRGHDDNASVFICTSVVDAGVTIPDVSFVFSPNVDTGVTNTGAIRSPTKAYLFELDNLTRKQRRGRTGRTTDGVFIYCKINGVEISERSYTFWDYVDTLTPSVKFSLPYFPKDILATAPKKYDEIIPLFDRIELVLPTLPSIMARLSPALARGSIDSNFVKNYIDQRYNKVNTMFGRNDNGEFTKYPLNPINLGDDETPFDFFGDGASQGENSGTDAGPSGTNTGEPPV